MLKRDWNGSCNFSYKNQSWWSRKMSFLCRFRHSRESGNPVKSSSPGLPPAREWRIFRLFTRSSKLSKFNTFWVKAPALWLRNELQNQPVSGQPQAVDSLRQRAWECRAWGHPLDSGNMLLLFWTLPQLRTRHRWKHHWSRQALLAKEDQLC